MRVPRNFDRWMFDYKEGNLSQSETAYFESIIEQNPEHFSDVEAWDNAYIKNQEYKYPHANQLQKTRRTPIYLKLGASLVAVVSIFLIAFNLSSVDGVYTKRNITSFNSSSSQNVAKVNSINLNNSNTSFNINNTNGNNNSDIILNESNESGNNNSILSNNESIYQRDFIELSNHSQSDNNHNTSQNQNNSKSIEQLKNENYVATYQNNPTLKTSKVKFIKKSKSNYGTFGYKVKKAIRKIEKMAGYPVGLVNLHDPEFMADNSNLLALNSSFAGSFGEPKMEMRYRNKWLGQTNNIQSSTISFDTYAKSFRGGIGVYFNRDDINNGTITNNNINLIYSPKLQISRKMMLEPSIKLTMGLMQINSKKIENNSTFEIENGRLINFNNISDLGYANNYWYKDISAGFILNHEKFYAGVNFGNISQHKEEIFGQNEKASIRIDAILGSDYQSRDKKMTLSPFVNYTLQNGRQNLWGGANFKYNWLTFGASYSTQNDFSLSLGTKFKTFKLVYQYDRMTSVIMNDKFSSHTIGLRINAKQKNRR